VATLRDSVSCKRGQEHSSGNFAFYECLITPIDAPYLDEFVVARTKSTRAQEFLQNEDESARSRVDRQFLAAKRLHSAVARCSDDAQKPAMESHKDKKSFSTAAKMLHFGNDIVSTSVAYLKLFLTQGFTNV
jgi:hypothetical protein